MTFVVIGRWPKTIKGPNDYKDLSSFVVYIVFVVLAR
jgi:hypothetical protein